jgi:hypothetical protein
MNPKAFISEINEGVSGFKSILLEVIALIEQRNRKGHPKLFSDKGKLIIVNSPLRINVDNLLEALRSGYDRGVLSIESYQEILGADPTTEKERRIKEAEDGDEDLFYPHLINNQEEKGTDVKPAKPRNEKNEDQNKNGPEKNNFKNAETINEPIDPNLEAVKEEELEEAPYKEDDSKLPEFIKKMPSKKCRDTFVATFNTVYKDTGGDEGKAFSIGYAAAKRCMKKEGYTYDKESKKWEKK